MNSKTLLKREASCQITQLENPGFKMSTMSPNNYSVSLEQVLYFLALIQPSPREDCLPVVTEVTISGSRPGNSHRERCCFQSFQEKCQYYISNWANLDHMLPLHQLLQESHMTPCGACVSQSLCAGLQSWYHTGTTEAFTGKSGKKESSYFWDKYH